MLRQIMRVMSIKLPRGIDQNKAKDIEFNLSIIQNSINYSRQNIDKVMRAYYYLGIHSKGINIPWDQNSCIKESFTMVTQIIPFLTSDQLIHLSISASNFYIKDYVLWSEIDSHLSAKRFFPIKFKELPRICHSLSFGQCKNHDTWLQLEGKVLECLDDVSEDNTIRKTEHEQSYFCSIIAKSFLSVGQGSSNLLKKLFEGMKNDIHRANLLSLRQTLESIKLAKHEDHELQEITIKRLIEFIKGKKKNNSENIILDLLEINLQEQLLIDFENMILQSDLPNYTLFDIYIVMSGYKSKFKAITENRRDFIVKIIEHVSKNYTKLLDNDDKNSRHRLAAIVKLSLDIGLEANSYSLLDMYRFLNAPNPNKSGKEKEILNQIEIILQKNS